MRPKAPPLAGVWLNCEPIPYRDLRGRVTVLLFWAVSCEASHVRLHQLEGLRRRLGGRIALIAVHSPRLQSDIDEAAVRQTVRRHGLSMPVVHDPQLESYGHYGIEGRPTTIVIDHRGRVVGAVEGLDDLALIDEAATLADSIASQARERSGKTPASLPAVVSSLATNLDRLMWPSGVCQLANGDLAVADSGNHRLLTFAIDEAGRSAAVNGETGELDGIGRVCWLERRKVAVSFPSHGRVEILDLDTGERRTLLDGLSRPQGVMRDKDGSVLIADAGADQLIRVCPDGSWGPVAGSGFSGTRDGDAGLAELRQPVGIGRLDRGVIIAEAGSNALRLLTDKGQVMTLTAHDREGDLLLDPGLVDGPAHSGRLQRPVDVSTLEDGSVVVVDSANDRLRVLADRKLQTVPLAGLSRPEAIAKVGPDRVVVADTANHRLVVVDLTEGSSWALDLTGFLPPDPIRDDSRRGPGRGRTDSSHQTTAPETTAPETSALEASAHGSVALSYPTPGNAPWTINVTAEPSWLVTKSITVRRDHDDQPVVVHLGGAGSGELVIHVRGSGGDSSEFIRRPIMILPD